jgi:hypothetical protein
MSQESKRIVFSNEHAKALGGDNLYNLFPPGSKWCVVGREQHGVVTVTNQSAHLIGPNWFINCRSEDGHILNWYPWNLTAYESDPSDPSDEIHALKLRIENQAGTIEVLMKKNDQLEQDNRDLESTLKGYTERVKTARAALAAVRL